MLHPRLPRSFLALLLAATLPLAGRAQFTLQDSNTTASLRGISAPGNGVAWASGTGGTVLRTEDGGYVWQGCAMPPGAEKLDFRGIQAFDGQTVLIMSSGKGDLSRVYKTTDGCRTWKLVFTNPDPDGFWDALVANSGRGFLIGDPVEGRFQIYSSEEDDFESWQRFGETSSYRHFRFDLSVFPGEALFAASNSSLLGDPSCYILFASGGDSGSFLSLARWAKSGPLGYPTYFSFKKRMPFAKGASAGAFSIAVKLGQANSHLRDARFIAVGGDYKTPDETSGTAAWSHDGGEHWNVASSEPHGYRSSVAYDAPSKTWITVGPNGTDLSRDDGRHWSPLRPGKDDAPDADKNWNALSLPFVVGPHGRIGRLRDDALRPPR